MAAQDLGFLPATASSPACAGRPSRCFLDRAPFPHVFNLTGHPAASIPCGFNGDGLPVGLQILGGWHADALVLGAASSFEAIRPWQSSRPPIE